MRDLRLRLDSLDASIMGSLLGTTIYRLDLRKSASIIARELRVDEATVRARMRRWNESGFLLQYGGSINPALLGQSPCILRIEVPDPIAKGPIKERLKLVDGLYRIRDYYGSALLVSLFFDNEETLKRRTDLISRIAGSKVESALGSPFEPLGHPDPTDMLVLATMMWPSRRSFSAMAKDTGLSIKTVRKRVERLLESRIIGMGLLLDFRRVVGATPGDLLVKYGESHTSESVGQEIRKVIGDRLLPPAYSLPMGGLFRILLGNLSEAKEVLSRTGKIPGVTSCSLDLLLEDTNVIETYSSLERVLVERMNSEHPLPIKTLNLWKRVWNVKTTDVYGSA